MIQQLNPPIPVFTPKGKAIAHFLIDYGMESDLQWVCLQDQGGECWTWKNPDIRAQLNITQGRTYISPLYNTEEFSEQEKENNICDECGNEHDEEIQEEECEEECEESSYEKRFNELRAEHWEISEKYYKQITRIDNLETVLRNLIRNGHVYEESLNEVLYVTRREDETMQELYSLIPAKSLRNS